MFEFLKKLFQTAARLIIFLLAILGYFFYNTFIYVDYEYLSDKTKDEMTYLSCAYPGSINTKNGSNDWEENTSCSLVASSRSDANCEDIFITTFGVDLNDKDINKDRVRKKSYYLNTSTGEIEKFDTYISINEVCVFSINSRSRFCVSRKDLSIYGGYEGRTPNREEDGSWKNGNEGNCDAVTSEWFNSFAKNIRKKFKEKIETEKKEADEELKRLKEKNVI